MLSLYTGESFKVNPGANGVDIPEKKIDSFHFHDLGNQRYRVEHKSGLVEILARVQGDIALPVQMRSPQGHSVSLEYVAFGTGPLLSSIRNADGTQMLKLVRSTNWLDITLFPDSAHETLFRLYIEGGETRSLILPTDDQASWRFGYVFKEGLTCLAQVDTPTGARETVTYSAKPHSFPGLASRKLPRVERHVRNPGFGQPAVETRYEYDARDHNFLGYGSGVSWSDDGLDNLYKVGRTYWYETTEILWDGIGNQKIQETRRVFNHFHLQTQEETIQYSSDPSKHTLKRTDTEYHLVPNLAFKDQPPYCQLPKTVTQTWHLVAATTPRHVETVSTTYDNFGNLLTQVNANGVTETSEWYKAEGEDGCPADPQGFVRNLKRTTVIPAKSDYGNAPTLQTRYTYGEHPSLIDKETWLALKDETLVHSVDGQEAAEVRHLRHDYIIQPTDPASHGLLRQMTQRLNGQDDTLTTTRYTYNVTRNARINALVMRTDSEVIGFDDTPGAPVRKTITKEVSLHNGQEVSVMDGTDTAIAYRHDRLGRVVEEIASPGSVAHEARRTYLYTLTNGGNGQQATERVTDVNGVETVNYLDGFSRVIRNTRRDADGMGGDTEKFRDTYLATYNNRGHLITETDIDWEGAADKPLLKRFEYDAWGEQYKVIGPDGVAHVTEVDPTTNTLRTWSESTVLPIRQVGKTRSTLNVFGKEDKVEALDAQGKMVAERLFLYDGLGNCVEQINEMGESTRFEYDLFSRLHVTTLPDYTAIRRSYAAHSADELATKIEAIVNEVPVNVGEQTYDGLERRTALAVGNYVQRFEYEAGRSQVSKMITASQKTITYEYQLGLVDLPVGSIAPDEQSSFTYDERSAKLTLSQNTQGKHVFGYSSTGELRNERWTDKASSKEWETTYSHTLNGRPLSRLDTNGLACTYTYDDRARIKTIAQGQLLASFDYDDLGRANVVTTRNQHTGQVLQTTLTFDDQGREISREMLLDGHPKQTVSQTYRSDSKLRTRHLQVADQTQLLETFDYDPRGRMVAYYCDGPALPQDRYKNPIKEQLFIFDALDNVTEVYTQFADGSGDESMSYFSPHDPCQLIEVTHKHPDYPPSCKLEYDGDGNLLQDENGQTLHYDSQGRLLRVSAADGTTVSHYRYDAHNHLLGVTKAGTAETLHFYQDERLARTEQADKKIHYLYIADQPLGQQQQDDPEQTLLLLTDNKNSVLAEGEHDQLRRAVYGAYGERNPDDDLKCLLGFNGEVRDEISGWYLLGRGYRAYNPTLMRFHSPDSYSPFGAGGINRYAYCAGDPINFVDPTGHANRGINLKGVFGAFLASVGILLTVAAVIVAPPIGVASTIFNGSLAAVGVGFGGVAVYEGVMATHAVKLKDRERYEKSAMIAGGLDALFGVVGLYFAMKEAAKRTAAAAAAAAQSRWHDTAGAGLNNTNFIIPRPKLINNRTASADAATQVNSGPPVPPKPKRSARSPVPDEGPQPGPSRNLQPVTRPSPEPPTQSVSQNSNSNRAGYNFNHHRRDQASKTTIKNNKVVDLPTTWNAYGINPETTVNDKVHLLNQALILRKPN
ncbi:MULTISPECIES: RHS repeat-associated core domain-containing protein [unclassified Pseudomonas]|nr:MULTISPECIES: RHS repeat-associated core domain-containing protein [unclassified Pseudomonas]